MSKRLTDRLVKSLSAPTSKYRITYDSEVSGFGIRITRTGSKAFVLNYVADGRERRYTIGKYPAWSVAAARIEASRLRQLVDQGHDPMGARHASRDEPTVADLCDRYLSDYALPNKRPSSIKQDSDHIRRHIKPAIGKVKVSAVTYSDIERLHRKASEHAPYQANRMLALLSKMFNLAIRWQLRADNPAKGVPRNRESRRERYMSGDELRRLCQALADYPYMERVRLSRQEQLEQGQRSAWRKRDTPIRELQRSCNAIRLLMLTGARRNEVLSATWDQFNFESGIWTKPGATTKQKTTHRVPLSAPALELLAGMEREADYLFPGRAGGHQLELKNTWATVCELAGIENLRLHDLRHSYASQLASAGLSLPIIGALLGHTQTATTSRYAHLMDDPLRQATERVGAAYTSAQTGQKADVVRIKQ